MGLIVRSLEDLPETSDRRYYIYLLDYGWHEPLSEALKANFDRLASSVSRHQGVVIRAADDGIHFNDEVLSWHSINGEDVERERLLPAILITNRPPAYFKVRADQPEHPVDVEMVLAIIPLKRFCKTTTDVVDAMVRISNDIKSDKGLNEFRVVREMRPSLGRALVKGVILEPNIAGFGFNLKEFFQSLNRL